MQRPIRGSKGHCGPKTRSSHRAQPICSRQWLRELQERFLDQPDASNDSYERKLERQLEGSPPVFYQLVGEALYFYFLIVATQDSSGEEELIEECPGIFSNPW